MRPRAKGPNSAATLAVFASLVAARARKSRLTSSAVRARGDRNAWVGPESTSSAARTRSADGIAGELRVEQRQFLRRRGHWHAADFFVHRQVLVSVEDAQTDLAVRVRQPPGLVPARPGVGALGLLGG